ncbi:MAG: L,D-transpeptidase family protein [Burkholderiales bacterium]|nr:L,D-transpeptidase family protein [Burkholderiales bacterium]
MKPILLCTLTILNTAHALNKMNLPFNIPTSTTQLIVVTKYTGVMVDVAALQKNSTGKWQQILPTIKANCGSQGIAAPNQKKEGDNKTPSGLYKLGPAYGTHPLALKMDYRYITNQDKFIDDPDSSDYNTWVEGDTTAQTYEIMNQENGAYDLGVVINYNMNPIVPGRGSAIFMHIWQGPNIGTQGCIAMDRQDMLHILKWLNKNANPYILIVS